MSIKINTSQHIIDWLASMGYPVAGMPREAIEGVFLREARQWENLGPAPVSPWYRHGSSGSAPERVQMACALRFGGMNSWHLPLEGLIPREEMAKRLPHRGEELDLWLGRLWSGWVMGGSR